jgi:hypothetical protein
MASYYSFEEYSLIEDELDIILGEKGISDVICHYLGENLCSWCEAMPVAVYERTCDACITHLDAALSCAPE